MLYISINEFLVWHLSDMGTGTENLTVGFFLFGDVYKEHWKLQVGTVVGLLNPSIMKQEKVRLISILAFANYFAKLLKLFDLL